MMTIPRLQGLDETIGPALAQLTETIGTLLNPTAKYDHALKQLFLEKPELMQKFVDVEKTNPGTLKAFGFGEGATNFLSGMEESIPSVQQRLGRDVLETSPEARRSAGAQAATGQTPGELTGDSVRKWLLGGGLQLMRENPKAAQAAMRKIVGLPTEVEEEQQAGTLEGIKAGKALKDKTPQDIVNSIAAGTLRIKDLSGGLLNPQTEGGVRFALQMWGKEKDAELRKELRRIGSSEHNNSVLRAKMGAAIDQRKAAGYLGSIDAHYQSIWGEPYSDTPATAEEVEAVTKFQEDAGVQVRVKQQQNVMKSIEPLLNQIQLKKKGQKPITEGEAKLKINQINKILKDAGIEWEARYNSGVRNWWPDQRPGVVFTNKLGQVTNDPSVLISEIPPLNTVPRRSAPPTLSGDERRITAWLNTLTPEQQDEQIKKLYEAERAAGGDGSRTDGIVDEIEAQ